MNPGEGHFFTIKRLFFPLLARPGVVQFIKYAVYLSLTINFVVYVRDDYLAWQSSLPPDAPLADILSTFSTTIDTAAWMGLILLFELETYALPDHVFNRWVVSGMRLARAICYITLTYAAYGYTSEALENYKVEEIPSITNACQFAGQSISMQMDTIAYEEITKENCSSISDRNTFYRIDDDISVIDESKLEHVQMMGWVDICNAFFWIFVVLLIEIEILLQINDRFASGVLGVVRQVKTSFYLVLIINGLIWFFTNYYIYAWDAFLWIFGFWVIELNLAEWEQDRLQELADETNTT
jgi:hypothetical protein